MELRELETFVKVVQAGSFTRAAELLNSPKASVSRTVSALERELGVRLLERTTRSLRLTEVGRELFERAVAIGGAVEDARRMAQQQQSEPRGTLRLTCGVEFGMLAVGGWINAFLARYPDVRVEADFTGRVVDLGHEGFDLAIRLGPPGDLTYAARRLGELHYGLYAAPAYLARRGVPAAPAELAAHDWVLFTATRSHATIELARGAERHVLEPAARLRVNNSFAVRDAAAAGFGLARLPRLVGEPAVQAGALSRVLPDWLPPAVPVHAVYPGGRYLTAKVRAFVDCAREQFTAESAGS